MRKLFLLMFTSIIFITVGCEFVVVEEHLVEEHHGYSYHSEEICYVEPFAYAPEQCWRTWNSYDMYEDDGECCEWDVGGGHFEDWCLSHDECDWQWEYTGHYTYR